MSVSRQLQDVAPQGGGLIAATILFLSLAWSGIDPQGAEAVFDIPYQVRCKAQQRAPAMMTSAFSSFRGGARHIVLFRYLRNIS